MNRAITFIHNKKLSLDELVLQLYFWFCHQVSEVVKAFNEEGNFNINEDLKEKKNSNKNKEKIIQVIKDIDTEDIHRPTNCFKKLNEMKSKNVEKIRSNGQEMIAYMIFNLELFDYSKKLNVYQVKNVKYS